MLLAGHSRFRSDVDFGHVMTQRIELQGTLAPLAETIRDRLLRRYDAAAFGALFAFWGAGVKSFIKDRRRLFGLR